MSNAGWLHLMDDPQPPWHDPRTGHVTVLRDPGLLVAIGPFPFPAAAGGGYVLHMVSATKRGGVNLASILGFLVVIALLAVVAWAILREDETAPPTTGGEGAGGGACEALVTVQVTTTEDFAPVVESAADRVEENDECVRY